MCDYSLEMSWNDYDLHNHSFENHVYVVIIIAVVVDHG